nr:uncharacterized protein LOC128699065 [Cherax quadricarinatus]
MDTLTSCTDWNSTLCDDEGVGGNSSVVVVEDVGVGVEGEHGWTHIRRQLHWAFPVHIYGFACLFFMLAFYTFFSILNLRSQISNRPFMSTINVFLCVLGVTRAACFLIDPYTLGQVMPGFLGSVMWDVGYPCILSAFSLIQLAFSQLTQVKFRPETLRRKSALSLVITTHFALVLGSDIVTAFESHLQVVRWAVQTIFLSWGLVLCVTFLYGGARIIKLLRTIPHTAFQGGEPGAPNNKGILQLALLAQCNNIASSVLTAAAPSILTPKIKITDEFDQTYSYVSEGSRVPSLHSGDLDSLPPSRRASSRTSIVSDSINASSIASTSVCRQCDLRIQVVSKIFRGGRRHRRGEEDQSSPTPPRAREVLGVGRRAVGGERSPTLTVADKKTAGPNSAAKNLFQHCGKTHRPNTAGKHQRGPKTHKTPTGHNNCSKTAVGRNNCSATPPRSPKTEAKKRKKSFQENEKVASVIITVEEVGGDDDENARGIKSLMLEDDDDIAFIDKNGPEVGEGEDCIREDEVAVTKDSGKEVAIRGIICNFSSTKSIDSVLKSESPSEDTKKCGDSRKGSFCESTSGESDNKFVIKSDESDKCLKISNGEDVIPKRKKSLTWSEDTQTIESCDKDHEVKKSVEQDDNDRNLRDNPRRASTSSRRNSRNTEKVKLRHTRSYDLGSDTSSRRKSSSVSCSSRKGSENWQALPGPCQRDHRSLSSSSPSTARRGSRKSIKDESEVEALLARTPESRSDVTLTSILNHIAYVNQTAAASKIPTTFKDSRKSQVQQVLLVTYVTAALGTLLSLALVYGLYEHFSSLTLLPRPPWLWFTYESSCRFLEFLMGCAMANITRQPVNRHPQYPYSLRLKQRNSLYM